MVIKNTLLSQKDAELMENAIVEYGSIVSFDQLNKIFKHHYSDASAKNRISQLSKLGWLIRLKKGFYLIVTDLGSLSLGDVSYYIISKALNNNSYVSFENALQFHGMFDQMLSRFASVTYERARKYKIVNSEIKFFKIKKDLYFGFQEHRIDMKLVNIASKEKAILDILYFCSNDYYKSLVWEKLSDYKHDLNFYELMQYAERFNLSIIRQIGFFLDKLGIDTNNLYELTWNKRGYSKMTSNSETFDSKWRLYFDDKIIK